MHYVKHFYKCCDFINAASHTMNSDHLLYFIRRKPLSVQKSSHLLPFLISGAVSVILFFLYPLLYQSRLIRQFLLQILFVDLTDQISGDALLYEILLYPSSAAALNVIYDLIPCVTSVIYIVKRFQILHRLIYYFFGK